MEPIFVLDCEFSKNRTIKEIGVSFVIELDDGKYIAARPPDHHLIRLGNPGNADDGWTGRIELLGACEVLKNMGAPDKMWASWGTGDRHELKRQTEDAGLEMPVGYFHIDIAPMYAALMALNRPIRLKKAAEELTGRFYGAQHHADDDSYNAARILAHLMNQFDRS